MRREINRFVSLVVDSLDNVSLLSRAAVRKDGVSSCQIFQVCLERTDVDRGTMRDVLRNSERIGDFLHRVEPGELSNAHTHGVARMDETVGARENPTISSIRISRRPISRAVDFPGPN